jgi:opacity protein-like surface antigen
MFAKVIPVVLLFCVASALPSFAGDGHRPYIGAQFGVNAGEKNDAGLVSDMEFDTGIGGAISIGFDHGWRYAHARSELEFAYRQADIDGGNLDGLDITDGQATAMSVLFNLYYSVETESIFTPYLMGGLGVASLELDNVEIGDTAFIDDSQAAFAYQAGTGVDVMLTDNWTLDLAYRYFGTADKEFENNAVDQAFKAFDYRYESHNAFLGLRYTF